MERVRFKVRRNSEFGSTVARSAAGAVLLLVWLAVPAVAEELVAKDPVLVELIAGYEKAKRTALPFPASPVACAPATQPVAVRPSAVFAPAFLAYARLRERGTDAIIALDWITTEAPWAFAEYEAGARLIEQALDLLGNMDPTDKLVRESTAFAGYQAGNLLYLNQPMPYMRSHDAAMSPITDGDRIARARKAFQKAAEADPTGQYGVRAREFLTEIDRQRVHLPAPDLIGQDPQGKDVRLSQYKGKVVMIKFYGLEYGTAGDQFEKEREVFRSMAGKPFVWLLAYEMGGNVVAVYPAEKADQEFGHVNPVGAQRTEWAVRGLPQTYVVDGAGMVQYAASGTPEPDLLPRVKQVIERLGKK